MKVIDLLNKIANGEEVPEKIKYNDKIWRLASDRTYFIGSDYGYDFWVAHGDDKFEDEVITLNDEVEILEEPKGIPEKLEILPNNEQYSNKVLYGKINEIIEYLESKGE